MKILHFIAVPALELICLVGLQSGITNTFKSQYMIFSMLFIVGLGELGSVHRAGHACAGDKL